jgi:hypothetical protein
MTTEAKLQLTSSELGTLWMTYIQKTAKIKMFEHLKAKTIDKEAESIINNFIIDTQNIINKIDSVFNKENTVIPLGFDEHDFIKEAPFLFDDIFNIVFLRQMMKLSFGYSGVFASISYMKDVNDIFLINYEVSNKYYMLTTNYLLGKGVLSKPPYVTMPKRVEFIEDKSYMSGLNIFSHNRAVNTIEIGYINDAIEYHIFNINLLTGFAQVTADSEIKKYFIEGKEISKKIVKELSEILLEGDIKPSFSSVGRVTDSTKPPFSDKIMMYINSLICSTTLGYSSLGTSFSMRKDLPLKLAQFAKYEFDYARKGAKLMIKHKWMEEPPQMNDRDLLIKKD